MEIWNSIWNVLTTENEVLTKIITAPTVLIELWLDFLLFTSLLKIKYNNTQKVKYIIYLSLTSLSTEFIITSPYNIFLNYFIMFIFIKISFKNNTIITILSTIIPTIIFALVGTLILNPFINILDINYIKIESIPIYRIIYISTLYLIILIILILINLKNLKLNIIKDFTTFNKKIIILNLISGFFILCIQAILTVYYISIVPLIITLFNFLSLFVYFFISFYSLNRTMKLQLTTMKLENTENYNSTLSMLYDNVKAFKHDFDNMVFTIGGFINTNDIEGLQTYYKNFEKDCQQLNNIALLNPQIINNSGIYNLLMVKYKKANDLNIEINLDFFFDFNKLNMPIYDFSRILGIFLDNAIEATIETTDRKINLLFRDSGYNHTQIIEIENTYINKNIDKLSIFKKGITEKKGHSGMGLWEVNQILKRNNNINLTTSNNEIYFKQHLEIYY